MTRLWPSLVLLVWTACYAPEIPDGAPCPDGVCPTGQVCTQAGRCRGPEPFDEVDAQAPDGGPDASPTPSPSPSPEPEPWQVARIDVSIAGSDDQDATLTGDQLEIVWSSNRPGGSGNYDLWHATRSTMTAA